MMKKTPEQLKRETADLLAAEREKRRVRQARERRDGAILHAYDRLAADSTEGPNGLDASRWPTRCEECRVPVAVAVPKKRRGKR